MDNVDYFLSQHEQGGLSQAERTEAVAAWNKILEIKLWAAADAQYVPERTKPAALTATNTPLLPGEENERLVFYNATPESFGPRFVLLSDP